MSAWRTLILALSNPLTQRFVFAHYVLGESRMVACAIAGATQYYGPMDEIEYDLILDHWQQEPA